MAEVTFTDIIIIGNSTSKPPRKEGKNKEGRDQFVITFTLSRNVKGAWVEAFNRVCGGGGKPPSSLQVPVVSDDQIQITHPLDDQLQGHLDRLKQEVAVTNQRYREYLQAIEDERRSNDEVLRALRF